MIEFILKNKVIVYITFGFLVFALSAYLGFLYKGIKRQSALLRLEKRKQREAEREKAEYYAESIRIISLAAVQKQCDVSEACIRLKKLLESLSEFDQDPKLEPLFKMYEEIKDFPILDQRDELSKQVRFDQDKLRLRIENKYQDSILKTFEYIHSKFKKV